MANGFHILIVDDRPDTVLGLMDMLTAERHRVEIQENSMEALSLLARKQTGNDPFHLIILDVNMPILDGPGLLRELRRRGDRVPAAYITGYNSVVSRIQQEGLSFGLLGILTKPPDIHSVKAVLAKLGAVRGGDSGGEAFFGTGRLLRGRSSGDQASPSEGALSRAKADEREQAAPLDIGAALEARPQRLTGGVRTPTKQQPIITTTPLGQPQLGQNPFPKPESHGIRRIRTPDPTVYYAPDGTSLRMPDEVAPDPMATLRRDPVTGSYSRKPSGLFPSEPNPLPTTGTTTSIRRTIPPQRPGEVESQGGAQQGPFSPVAQARVQGQPSTGTVRFRRGLSGNQAAPPGEGTRRETNAGAGTGSRATPVSVPAAPTRVVACAHCAGVFQVLIHSQPYAVQCVHCQQLNRIDPT